MRQKIQLALLIALLVATARTGYIFYQRHEERLAEQRQKLAREAGYSNADYYVTPRKLYPYDLKSAKQLTQQPAWVREGYHYAYYSYEAAGKRVDFGHDVGVLGPIEKLSITDVVTAMAPGAKDRQVMAVFVKDGRSYAMAIGVESEGTYRIYSDEIFYFQDPHELYKHWPADVWQAVDQHQVKARMTELEAVFAVGMGVPDAGASSSEKTVRYPNGGKPLVVVYRDGKAAEIAPGP